eukprot:TRINITY_DN4038_c0_g1_i1.p2 TRINITY_DN4038_c0_g1~~TRINITY_DN4038_c0_g1_i1.p2  ORF type:complete len:197 (-),score=30.97 TRINITY_DN4038_c0_g1_i1:204-794(-)
MQPFSLAPARPLSSAWRASRRRLDRTSGIPDTSFDVIEEVGFERSQGEGTDEQMMEQTTAAGKAVAQRVIRKEGEPLAFLGFSATDAFAEPVCDFAGFVTPTETLFSNTVHPAGPAGNGVALVLWAPDAWCATTKESLVALLETAEALVCEHVVLCIDSNAPELQTILRAYMFLGFSLVPPTTLTVPGAVVLACTL